MLEIMNPRLWMTQARNFSLVPKLAALVVFVAYLWYFKSRVNQSDFLVFYRAADAVLKNHSPYPPPSSAAVYSGSSFVYPYVIAWLFTPFTLLDRHNAEFAFVAVSLISIVAALWFLEVRRLPLLLLFLFASTSIVAWQIGTLNPLFMVGVAIGWRYREKAIVLGLSVALIAFAKLFLVPLLLWLVISRRYRALAASAVTIGVMLWVSFVLGPLSLPGYFRLLTRLARHEGIKGYSTSALFGSLRFGIIGSDMAVVVVATFIGLVFFHFYLDTRNEKILVGGALVVALIITPILWTSYLPLAGVAGLLLFSEEFAVVSYSVCSWLVTTPDRAQSFELFLILSAVILMVVYLSGSFSEFLNRTRLYFQEMIDNRVLLFLIGSIVLVVVGTVFDPALLPLLVTQCILVLVVPGLMLFKSREDPTLFTHKTLIDAGSSDLDDDGAVV